MVDPPPPPPVFFFSFFFPFFLFLLWLLFVIVLFSALEQTHIALCTVPTQPCTMSRHFNESHIQRMHACLAVTCYLHFWQNDRDLIRATAVTRGGTDTQIKFSRRSCRDSNPRSFDHQRGALNTEPSPHPARPPGVQSGAFIL